MPSYSILTIPRLLVYFFFFHITEPSAILAARDGSVLAGRKPVPNSSKQILFNMTAALCFRHVFIQTQCPQFINIGHNRIPNSSLTSQFQDSYSLALIITFLGSNIQLPSCLPLPSQRVCGFVFFDTHLGAPGLFGRVRPNHESVMLSSLHVWSPYTHVYL